jgi:hypothetical protein
MAGDYMTFTKPNFGEKHLELKLVDGEVCLYATEQGLKQIISFCETLIDKPNKGHIHLEDYKILSDESLRGVIAVFPTEKKNT